MKFNVLAWIFCVSLRIQLISCKEVELNCATNSDAYDFYKQSQRYCEFSNSCIISGVVAEKDDELYLEDLSRKCIIFTNSSLYTIPELSTGTGLENIYASNSSLEVLPDVKWERMNRLLFENNHIKIIPHSFKITSCVIDFSNNQISTIDKNVFEMYNGGGDYYYPNFKECEFDLSNNLLEILPLKAFSKFFGVNNFSGNIIKEIKNSRAEFDSHSFNSFDFSKNMLKSIPVNLFKQFGIFKTLDLSYNKIETTNVNDSAIVANVISMTFLNLSFNKIQEFSFSFMKFFRQLNKIDVSNNQIECFADIQFYPYLKIKEINMNNNKIKILPSTIFSHVFSDWDLSYNLIEEFSDFQDTEPNLYNHIKKIDISHNSLETLPINVFSKIKIIELKLNNNQIRIFTNFSALIQTETLDLSHNNIKIIPFETFTNSSITNLILNNNKIRLNYGIFPINVEMIDLRFNNLDISDIEIFLFYNNLHTIFFDNNKSLFLLLDELKFSNIKTIGISKNNYLCWQLIVLLKTLKSADIGFVINNSLVNDSPNINGIECSNPFF